MATYVEFRHNMPMSAHFPQSSGRAEDGDLPNRIKQLREARGWSMSTLGKALGVEAPTVNKLEKGETQLTTRWMKRIATALGVHPMAILFEAPQLRTVRVVGRVQAGEWAESYEWNDPEDGYDVAVPDAEDLRGIRLFALEVRGPSMNKLYPDGSVIVVASIFDTEEELASGTHYAVERIRPDGFREATVKTFEVDGRGRKWLVPESTEPGFAPIALDGDDFEEDETVQALGRVVWSVRRE